MNIHCGQRLPLWQRWETIAHPINLPLLSFPLGKMAVGTMANLLPEHIWRDGSGQNKKWTVVVMGVPHSDLLSRDAVD